MPLLKDALSSTRASPFALPAWQLAEAESAYGACLNRLRRSREGEALLRDSRAALVSDSRPAFRVAAPDRLRKRAISMPSKNRARDGL